jgi:hypothetical protein
MINNINTFSPPVVAFGVALVNINSLIKERVKYFSITAENSLKFKLDIILKISSNILNIVSGAFELVACLGKWAANRVKTTSSIVCLRAFSIFAIVIYGASCSIDLFRQAQKFYFLESRIEIELKNSSYFNDFRKEKEITIYKVVKYCEMIANGYAIAASISAVGQFFSLIVVAPGVILTTGVLGGVLYSVSFALAKIYNVEQLEEKYFGKWL